MALELGVAYGKVQKDRVYNVMSDTVLLMLNMVCYFHH